MEEAQKDCSSTFADPLGVNKIVLESEAETENNDKYLFSQLSPANSKYNVEKEEEKNKREFLLSKGFVPFQNNKLENQCFRKNNIIYHNVIPTTFHKRVVSNNTIPNHSTIHTTQPLTTPNELVITIDSPEKHSSFFESFATFRIKTQTCRTEFMKSMNASSSPSQHSLNSNVDEANKITSPERVNKPNSNKVNNIEVKFATFVDKKVAQDGDKNVEVIEVRRRFNDFLWLRQQLESCHPTLFIPPLPERHKVLNKFSADFLNGRMVALSRFLNRLALHPILSFNPSFILFLTSKQWEFKFDMSKNNDRPNEVGGVINKISQSWNTINMKNRPMEFEEMGSRLRKLEEKLKISEKIVSKMQKEHHELLNQLQTLHPSLTLWAANENRLSPLLSSTSSCIASQSQALQQVLHDTETRVLVPVREYIMFLQAIKRVMRRRDSSQLHYERLCEVYEGKKHDANMPKEELSKAFEDMERYYDKHSCIEADLRAELDRFSTNQKRELKSIFKIFSENQMKFYKKNASLWDDVLRQSRVQKEEAIADMH